jgi:hypothetical protein
MEYLVEPRISVAAKTIASGMHAASMVNDEKALTCLVRLHPAFQPPEEARVEVFLFLSCKIFPFPKGLPSIDPRGEVSLRLHIAVLCPS